MYDTPEFLDQYADRLATNDGEFDAVAFRAAADAWRARERQVESLQRENTALHARIVSANRALATEDQP